MRRIVLVLELMEDEADKVVEAVSATDVRFRGCKLNDAVHIMLDATTPPDEHGNVAHHFTSDGAEEHVRPVVTCDF